MNILFIFGAKYLFLASIIIGGIFFLKQSKIVQKQVFIFGVASLAVSFIIARLSSLVYNNPRPFVVDHFVPLISHGVDNGFPSDHTLLCAAIASVLYPFSKKISLFAWVISFAVGISRVYVGVHHPIDILGSILIAIFSALIVYLFVKKTDWHQRRQSK